MSRQCPDIQEAMSIESDSTNAQLPGHEFVAEGLRDLSDGRETEAALILQIAAPRLRDHGITVAPAIRRDEESPEHRLYALLSAQPGAHSRYNALLARIASYAAAAEHATPR
jgi:hypothetical protein